MKSLHLASCFAIGLAVSLSVRSRLSRATSKLRPAEVFAGGAVVWCVLSVFAAALLRGGEYLFVWPVLLVTAIGVGLLCASRFDAGDPLAAALRASTAIPGIVLLLPLAMLLSTAFGPAAAGVVGAITALVCVLSAPAMELLLEPGRRLVPTGAAAVAVALLVAANLSPTFDAEHPRPDTLVFAVDQDRGKSYWLSPDAAPDAWTVRALAGAKAGPPPLPFPLRSGRVLVAEAPRVAEPGPEIVWIDEHGAKDDTRLIRLRIVAPPSTEVLAISVEPSLVSARVQGRAVRLGADGGLALSYSAPPPAGVELTLETRSRAAITVHALTQRAGFPADLGASLGPRPAGWMPRPGANSAWDELLESDMTLVAGTFSR